jgi:protein-disulfide isomerase
MKICHHFIRAAACSGIVFFFAIAVSSGAQNDAVAIVDKQVITDQDLDSRTAATLATQRSELDSRERELRISYERNAEDYRQRTLNALIDERVLALEAKAERTTPEALVASIKSPEITYEQLRSFYDSQRTQINQPFEKVSSQIKEYLEKGVRESARRQYLESLRTKFHATIVLEPRREQVEATGPARGPANARVTIVEFSDFQCPFCGRLEPILVQTLAKYPTQVRLVYRNYPLTTLHPDAQRAAEAAECAKSQGKFWEMHDLMFAEQSSLSVDALRDKARRLGLDTIVFGECLDSGKSREAIAADVHAGDQLGIVGTPASFINGRFVNGVVSENDLKALIDDELRRVGASVNVAGSP